MAVDKEKVRELDIKALDMLGSVIMGIKKTGKRFGARLVAIEKDYYVFVSSDGTVLRNWKGSMVDLTTFEENVNQVVY